MDQHLKEIDNEINVAYEMCIKAGYSHDEIMKYAQPLLNPVIRQKRQHENIRLIKFLSITFLIIGSLLSFTYYIGNHDDEFTEKANEIIRIVIRTVLMKTLSFWDWTPIYNSPCLIPNPYFIGSELRKTDCADCERWKKVDRLSNVSPAKFMDKYVMNSKPLIVEDGTQSWMLMNETFDVDSMLQKFLIDKSVSSVCPFNTSMPFESSNDVFDQINSGKVTKYFVRWVNCNKELVRYLRKFYSRPYFCSETIELTGDSWIVMSTGFSSDGYFLEKFQDVDRVLLYVQVRGSSDIRLLPKKPCHNSCPVINETLNEGEIIIISGKMWMLEYAYKSDTDNFILGLEAYV